MVAEREREEAVAGRSLGGPGAPYVTEARLATVREELGSYVDGLAERVAAVEALGAEARQAIANAHEVEEHYDGLKRRLTIVAALLAGAGGVHELELVERVLAPVELVPFER